jgi:hypothetical protein
MTKTKTYNRRDSQMVTHFSTSRPVQCLCMAERTGCPVFTDLWSYVLVGILLMNLKVSFLLDLSYGIVNTHQPPKQPTEGRIRKRRGIKYRFCWRLGEHHHVEIGLILNYLSQAGRIWDHRIGRRRLAFSHRLHGTFFSPAFVETMRSRQGKGSFLGRRRQAASKPMVLVCDDSRLGILRAYLS